MARVLGVDAGTMKAGLAVLDDRERLIYSSQVTLFGDHPAMRVACLCRRVQEAVSFYHVDQLAVEAPVTFGRTRDAGALWTGGGYHALLVMAEQLGWTRPLSVNVTTAKITLTGYGKADKQMMMQHAAQRWPDHAGLWGEDEADACAVALCGVLMVREAAMAQAAGTGKGGKRC